MHPSTLGGLVRYVGAKSEKPRGLQTEVANEAIALGFFKTRREEEEEEEEDERRRGESRERKVAIYSARNERARSFFCGGGKEGALAHRQ